MSQKELPGHPSERRVLKREAQRGVDSRFRSYLSPPGGTAVRYAPPSKTMAVPFKDGPDTTGPTHDVERNK